MAAAAQPAAPVLAPPLAAATERLRLSLLWLMGFSGAFVFVEPSPYEVVSLMTLATFALTGLTLSAAVMPLAILLILINAGFTIAVVPVIGEPKTLIWVLVSWYLAGTAVFVAAMLAQNTTQRLDLLVRGYTMAGLAASMAAFIGYFNLVPGLSGLFTKFGRAQGTFNDPNVLGAFLVFPALVALQRMLSGRAGETVRSGILLAIFTVAVLLSFSRAAWGQLVGCAALTMLLTFLISGSARERLRIVMLAFAGMAALAALIAVILSIDQVGELFRERASLDQSYDKGPTGRFGRWAEGFLLALTTPFGLGPLQFAKFFPEDPHNSYLNVFMSGGWLAGMAYLALVAVTLASGLRCLFVRSPWQRLYVAVYVAYVGVAVESLVIDSDHWRHYFLLLGLQWGMMAAIWKHRRQRMPAGARPAAQPPHAPLAPWRRPA